MASKTSLQVLAALALLATSLVAAPDSPATTPATTAPLQPPATTRAALPTASEVIDRYIEATGGRVAYDSIKSRRAQGTFSMNDLGVEAKMAVAIRSDGNAMVTIDVPNVGVFRQGMTSGVVWSVRPTDGPRILTGDEALITARGLALSPEISLDGYSDVRVIDTVALNGRPTYRIVLTPPAGGQEMRLYDVESGLLARTIVKNNSPLGEITVSSNFSDYNDAPPIRLSMKVQQMLPGASLESVMTKVEHNVDLPDALFALPPEIVDLQKRKASARPATLPASGPAAK